MRTEIVSIVDRGYYYLLLLLGRCLLHILSVASSSSSKTPAMLVLSSSGRAITWTVRYFEQIFVRIQHDHLASLARLINLS